jgi:hypothetical protein
MSDVQLIHTSGSIISEVFYSTTLSFTGTMQDEVMNKGCRKNENDKGKRDASGQNCPNDTMPTINPTWAGMISNPRSRCQGGG